MSEAAREPGFFERTLANLRGAWREVANSAARSVGLAELSLPKGDRESLKRFMESCLEARGGEVSARLRAAELGQLYLQADSEGRRLFLDVLAKEFGVDPAAVEAAIAAYQLASGAQERRAAEQKLRQALVPPRLKLLTQFNALPEGVKFLVDLRADLLRLGSEEAEARSLDDDLRELLTSWFDVGFLDLVPITWDSSAALLEKLIAYEAVHEIRSWEDLRNRLDSDRRCYALFHPRMPEEPLAFVEVALVKGLAGNIQALLDEHAPLADPHEADTAVFYSISNTQRGLRGISFGEYLIKRAAARLHQELPRLKTFATLSPVPNLRTWLRAAAEELYRQAMSEEEQGGIRALGGEDSPKAALLAILERDDWQHDPVATQAIQAPLVRLAAAYFLARRGDGFPIDPVARFHLKNGARLERINWLGDSSGRGLRQSAGIMVNYRYDLDRIEANHEAYMREGQIVTSSEVRGLLKGFSQAGKSPAKS